MKVFEHVCNHFVEKRTQSGLTSAYAVIFLCFDCIQSHHYHTTMPTNRPYTKTTVEATRLLGQLIKLARKKRLMSEHTKNRERRSIDKARPKALIQLGCTAFIQLTCVKKDPVPIDKIFRCCEIKTISVWKTPAMRRFKLYSATVYRLTWKCIS